MLIRLELRGDRIPLTLPLPPPSEGLWRVAGEPGWDMVSIVAGGQECYVGPIHDTVDQVVVAVGSSDAAMAPNVVTCSNCCCSVISRPKNAGLRAPLRQRRAKAKALGEALRSLSQTLNLIKVR